MDRAVVLGGGIAGILAARVLTDHAAEVVVVERDEVSSGAPAPRRGVPQGRQVHGLLGRGLEAMEALFPGVTTEMVEAGGVPGDPGCDCHWYVDGVRKPPTEVGRGIACTRPFLEWHLRRRLLAIDGVRIVRGRAEGLTVTQETVDGVTLSGGDGDGGGNGDGDGDGGGGRLAADFVVDCTGQASRMGEWLTTLGYDRPPELKVNIDLGYATRTFRRGPEDRIDGVLAVISLTDDASRARGAVAFAVEDDRWMVTLGGYHHDRPRADAADFAARIADEPAAAIHRFAHDAEPLTDVATHRYPAGVRREFHRLARFPGGLVALGDSVASFNPIYGQGMSSAAIQAGTLQKFLAGGAPPSEPASDYFKRLRPVVESVWRLSATADFRLDHVTGDKPPGLWLTHKVTKLYTRATLRDAKSHRRFLRVVNLQEPPEALLRPRALLRAVRVSRRPLPPAV